jgi:hypothetical protein
MAVSFSGNSLDARPSSADAPPLGSDDAWQRLLGAKSDEAFCAAWLALLCAQLRDVTAAVVLLQSADASSFTPVALWPEAPRDLSHFGAVAQTALGEQRGVVKRASDQPNASWHIAYPLGGENAVVGAIALEVPHRSEPALQDLLRRLHWGLGILQERLGKRAFSTTQNKLRRLGSVVEVVAAAVGEAPLQQTLFDVANVVARELGATRVAIGLVERQAVRVAAMSDAAWFEKNTQAVKHYAAAMEEALDQLATIQYAPAAAVRSADTAPDTAVLPASPTHAALAQTAGARSLVSTPLLAGTKCIGVVTAERHEDPPFGAAELDWLDALASLLPGAIGQKQRAERGLFARLRDDVRKVLARFFGPRYLTWKLCGSLAVILVAALVLVQVDYRVRAKTVIEGEIQRAAVAPFEGYVAASYVRAGDVVRKGQVLCALEDRDLKLERDRWASEHEQRLRELREMMANHDLAQVQIIGAQARQAEAQLNLVSEKLARARVLAPFDGIVITGDLSQLIGSPVETGKKLFEVAPLAGYRVILQVDENEIRNVRPGQSGHLLVAGIAGEPLRFRVSKVTPVANAEDGRNFFRVEAQLSEAPSMLRPGMQGVGKIDAGERRLWWVLTHSFTDWLRITLWRWMP